VGSLAAIGYADKLVQVPLIIFSGSISTAIFPYFSRQAAENKLTEMSESISKSVRMSAFIFIPLTVMAVILAKPVISLLFEHGAFTPAATLVTSRIFVCYSFQIFFFTVAIIFYRAILALRDSAAFLKVALFSIILNVALNFIFIRMLKPPAAGIALSTSVVQAVSCVILSVFLQKRKIVLDWKYIFGGLLRVIPASAAAGAALASVYGWYASHVQCHTPALNAAGIVLGVAAGSAVFIAVSSLLGLEEVSNSLKAVREFNKVQ
jgi:putative peptidoglycan lipid II flippase